MKDIDFDELDRAVNSLMGGVKGTPDQPPAKTLTIAQTLKEDERPRYEKIKKAAERIGSETIGVPTEKTEIISSSDDDKIIDLGNLPATVAPQADIPVSTPVAIKASADAVVSTQSSAPKTGRFMDVMHPSSDMKTASQPSQEDKPVEQPTLPSPEAKSPARSVGHSGATITPPPRRQDEPTAPTATEDAHTPEARDVSVEPPIAVVEPGATPQSETAIEPPIAEEAVTPQSPEPQTSPFLPDAKVEKRPLGGATAKSSDDLNINSLDNLSSVDTMTDTQVAPQLNKVELPEELNTDLVAIETGAALEEAGVQVIESAPESIAAAESEKPAAASAADTHVKADESTPGSEAPVSGTIYDTNEYHKPVEHPAKTKSGWSWIILVILLVVICGGGAGAYYFLLMAQ